jgi:hypothetical protein
MEPTVSIHAYRRVQKENEDLLKKCETLRKLINGQWVDTQAVQDALEIDFKEGMKLFDFGRQVAWNKPPRNGQFIVTKFRICEKTIKPKPEVFWCEEDDIKYAEVNAKVNEDNHQWELVLEQQGGII